MGKIGWRAHLRLIEKIIKALNSYGGKLIEIEYTKDVSSTEITLKEKIIGTTQILEKQL